MSESHGNTLRRCTRTYGVGVRNHLRQGAADGGNRAMLIGWISLLRVQDMSVCSVWDDVEYATRLTLVVILDNRGYVRIIQEIVLETILPCVFSCQFSFYLEHLGLLQSAASPHASSQ